MALKVFDGLDHYNDSTDFLSRTGFLQWQFPNNFVPSVFQFVTGLTGFGKALRWGHNQNIAQPTPTIFAVWGNRDQEAYIGVRIKPDAGWSFQVGFYDSVGADSQLTITIDAANYSVSAHRGTSSGTLLGMSANNVWTGGVGNFFEFHYKIANTGGVIEVRNNGATVLSITGVDTQITANAWADVMSLLPFTAGIAVVPTGVIDDIYYCDTVPDSGSSGNDSFLGDSRTSTVFATGNDAVQFTPLANQNWQEISEVAMDSDTSYNFSANAGDQDTFVFAPTSNVITTIYGIQVTYAARKDDVGSRTMAGVIRISGTSYVYGTPDTVAAALTYSYHTDLWILNPNTGVNFTLSDLNAATYGYKLVT